jgi:hypothetical protein
MKAIQHSASSKKIWIFNNTPAGTSHFTVKYVSTDGKKVTHTECKYYSNGYLVRVGSTGQLVITEPLVSCWSQNHSSAADHRTTRQLMITVPPVSLWSQNHPSAYDHRTTRQLTITEPPVSFWSQNHPSASHHSTTRQLLISYHPSLCSKWGECDFTIRQFITSPLQFHSSDTNFATLSYIFILQHLHSASQWNCRPAFA